MVFMQSKPKLRDGCEWVDHEEHLIGNEEGLKNLIKACEVALDKGEYQGGDLDEYVGIRKLDTNWFEDPKDSQATQIGNKVLGLMFFLLFVVFLIGAGTVVTWIMQILT